MDIQKPLDALNLLRGQEIVVDLKNGTQKVGKLVAFDLNINITLEIDGTNRLIQGNNVQSVGKNQ